MAEPYDNPNDGYLGWDDDAEYAQFQRDYEEWVNEHLGDRPNLANHVETAAYLLDEDVEAVRRVAGTAHLDIMDHLGRTP